jgi:hypothetical protein
MMNELIKNIYFEIINEIEKNWLEDIENLVNYVGKIDVGKISYVGGEAIT